MNKAFRVIYNISLGCWVVVSEVTKSNRKSSGKTSKIVKLSHSYKNKNLGYHY